MQENFALSQTGLHCDIYIVVHDNTKFLSDALFLYFLSCTFKLVNIFLLPTIILHNFSYKI